MVIENERRYIVLNMDQEVLKGVKKWKIQQGYFETLNPYESVRIRIINNREAWAGRKEGSGFSREEKERRISLETARFLFPCCAHFLEKTRYFPYWPLKTGVWTVDFFEPPLTNLVIAEFEQQLPEVKVAIPEWICDAVDVTDSLSNVHLARLATELRTAAGRKPSLSVYEQILPKKIPRIVLTGGPCSGKSKMMEVIKEKMGTAVHCVPEVASILIAQVGVKPASDNPLKANRFNEALYRIQKIFEATSAEQAIEEGKCVMLLDRGTADNAAYLPNGLADLEAICHTDRTLEYRQYDLVICLEVPPKDIYEQHRRNNPARTETYEQALALGEKIKMAWKEHPNFHIIPNMNGWEEKEKAVLQLLKQFLP